jgi:hypothetical protein
MRPEGEDTPDLTAVVAHLNSPSAAMAASGLETHPDLDRPGLYAWRVDAEGARELGSALGHDVEPGLIYAGQAGATRERSGTRSTNTLRGRLIKMHLGGRRRFSTFRRTLGAVLDVVRETESEAVTETELTAWMQQHLRVSIVPWPSGDGLAALEHAVLVQLDPPFNLAGRPRTPTRIRLTSLRRAASEGDAVELTSGRRTYRTLDAALADFPSWPPANRARIREVIDESDYLEIYKPPRSFYLALRPRSGGPVVRVHLGYIVGIRDPRTGQDGIALPVNELREGNGPRSAVDERRAVCPICFMEVPVSGICGQCD